jgi:hypothetical protein
MQAVGMGMVTLVGFTTRVYPVDYGNCFSVLTETPKPGEKFWVAFGRTARQVVNMNHENFAQLINTGVLAWPVEIIGIEDTHCAIIDGRVPEGWKLSRICGICTPERLHEAALPYMRS